MLRIVDSAATVFAALSGFGLVAAPPVFRVVIAFYALFIVPGAALRRRFFGGGELSAAAAGETFILGVVFASIVVSAGFIPGVSYGAISVAALGATLALIWLPGGSGKRTPAGNGFVREAGRGAEAVPRRRPVSAFLLAGAFAACFFALYDRGELGPNTDALDHVSFVRRSVESGVLFPRDSFYREGDGASLDPRKGLWHPVLSLWVRAADVSADRVWRMAPACTGFFVLCVFYAFAVSLAGPGPAALLSIALYLVFGAGEGAAWLAKLGYSRNMALVLLWADVHFIARYCRHERRRDLAAAAAVSAAGAAFHAAFVLQALPILLGVFCFVLIGAGGKAWRAPFARTAAVGLASMAIPVALRSTELGVAHNLVHAHRQGMLVLSETLAIVDPAEIAIKMGPAFFFVLAAAPFYFLLTRGREGRSLLFFLFAAPLAIALTPYSAAIMERSFGYLHYRMLDAAPVAVMLSVTLAGLSRAAVRGVERERASRRSRGAAVSSIAARFAAIGALVFFAWYPLRIGIRATAAALRQPSTIEARYTALFRALEERIPPRSVIAADPRTSYVVSAFTDQFIAVTLDQHGSPSDPRALERLRGIRDLLSPAVPAEAAAAWLDSFGVEYVVVNESARDEDDFFRSAPPGGGAEARRKMESCPSMFRHAFAIEGFWVFEVARPLQTAAVGGACAAPLARALACEEGEADSRGGEFSTEDRIVMGSPLDAGGGIVLSRAVLDRCMLRTIDTLTGYFCWEAGRTIPHGLPLELIVRLDGAEGAGPRHDEWYGKQYRRYIERRRGVLHRLTVKERLRSGAAQPDLWLPGTPVRQDFAIPIPAHMAPGTYELRVKVRRISYLPVRVPADYLSNDDSEQGTAIALVYLQ